MAERELDPNPLNGHKGEFRKLTLTVPQEYYEKLVKESARRKISRELNQLISALLREALAEYLARLEA
jgi:predicted HicB family RNase H-like nuclease